IFHNIDCPVYGSSDSASQTHDLLVAVAYPGDSVQCSGDPRPVVIIKVTDPGHDLLDLLVRYFTVTQDYLAVYKPGGRQSSELHYDLKELVFPANLFDALAYAIGQY